MTQQGDYVLDVLLNKEVAYLTEKIAGDVKELVDRHFESSPRAKLSEAQLHKLTNIALYSPPSHVTSFIEKQANREQKEKKEEKKPWTTNELHRKLKEFVNKLEEKAKSLYEDTSKEAQKALGRAYTPSPEKKEKTIYSLKSRLLREMTTQFSIYYLSKC